MRHFNKLALLAALSLTGVSLAETSTSTDFNNATMSLSATGTAESAVSFTVPNASIVIPKEQVRPGSSFKVTIPVTNTTDRAITVSVTGVQTTDPSGKLTVTPDVDSATIPVGNTGTLVYTFTFAAATNGDQAMAGQDFEVDFTLSATSTYTEPQDRTF